ncbi:hypothetical protein O7608_29935 [Solwaraspora sp. WMMA2056]|uniref:hypothetical protein n=1 Tax=Solwaraspora sp. WMMA2056 TaxID=3015161 RepID=UPI00259B1D99|nr:hypothetical protein [Solwaraspora sp. WMMA2056]WJK40563.1 hypothetical protein O7608_29935 [Solwaraspora sp. WMMA2056]
MPAGRVVVVDTNGQTRRGWLAGIGAGALATGTVTALAQATGRFHWWAGFVLVPGALLAACGGPLLARGGGRAFGGYVIACAGALVFAVGTLLMLGLTGVGWPVMIILPCLAIAGTYHWRPEHPLGGGLHRTVALLSLTGAGLGATFLLITTGVVDLAGTGWWGAFMMLAAVAVLGNAVDLGRHQMPYRLQAVTLLAGPAVVAFLLGLRFLRGW